MPAKAVRHLVGHCGDGECVGASVSAANGGAPSLAVTQCHCDLCGAVMLGSEPTISIRAAGVSVVSAVQPVRSDPVVQCAGVSAVRAG